MASLRIDVSGNILKAHEGVKDIIAIPTNIQNPLAIQKIILARQQISSLEGIQIFKNLTLLSLENNNISSLNELRHLFDLPIEYLSLNFNKITKYPSYNNVIITSIPTLKSLDGNTVNDLVRRKSAQNLSKEVDNWLKHLLHNELKISELDNLIETANDSRYNLEKGRITEVRYRELTSTWLHKAKFTMRTTSIDDYNLSDEEKERKYNEFRKLAFEVKVQQEKENPGKISWDTVWGIIKKSQEYGLDDKTEEINQIIRSVMPPDYKSHLETTIVEKYTTSDGFLSPKNLAASPVADNGGYLHGTCLLSNSNKAHDKNRDGGRSHPNDFVAGNMSPPPSDMCSARSNASGKSSKTDGSYKSQISRQAAVIIINHKNKLFLSKFFHAWSRHCINNRANYPATPATKGYAGRSVRSRLVIQPTITISKNSRKTLPNTPENIELIEEAQRLAEQVGQLQQDIVKKTEELEEMQGVLEESVKRESQTKIALKKMKQVNKELDMRAQDAERKYEDEVVNLMLQQRFKYDDTESRNKELEKSSQKLIAENAALNSYVNELQDKLSNAQFVTEELRRRVGASPSGVKISHFDSHRESPPTNPRRGSVALEAPSYHN